MTNAEKIRSMSDEELAEVFGQDMPCNGISGQECYSRPSCTECCLKWLKEEAAN